MTLRARLERVWSRSRPNKVSGSELSAEGERMRTLTRDEFFGNLERRRLRTIPRRCRTREGIRTASSPQRSVRRSAKPRRDSSITAR